MKNKLKRKKECAKEAGIPVQREVASRLIVAGMGDALATYFEARACQRSEATSRAGGNTTGAAMALAELCFDTLMEVAKAACAEGDTLHNMPFTVTPESVFAAIKAADAYGRYYLGEE